MKKNIKVSKKQKVLHILLTILHIIGYVCIFIVAFALVLNSCSSKQPQKASASTNDERTYSGEIYINDFLDLISSNLSGYDFEPYIYQDYLFYDISFSNLLGSGLRITTDQYPYISDVNYISFGMTDIYSDVYTTFAEDVDWPGEYVLVYGDEPHAYFYDDVININTLNTTNSDLWYFSSFRSNSNYYYYFLTLDDYENPTEVLYSGHFIDVDSYITIQDLTYFSSDTFSIKYFNPSIDDYDVLYTISVFDFFDNYCDNVCYIGPEPPEPEPDLTNVFTLLTLAFSCIVPIFEISVVPGITFGLLFFLPLVTIIIVLVIKAVKP